MQTQTFTISSYKKIRRNDFSLGDIALPRYLYHLWWGNHSSKTDKPGLTVLWMCLALVGIVGFIVFNHFFIYPHFQPFTLENHLLYDLSVAGIFVTVALVVVGVTESISSNKQVRDEEKIKDDLYELIDLVRENQSRIGKEFPSNPYHLGKFFHSYFTTLQSQIASGAENRTKLIEDFEKAYDISVSFNVVTMERPQWVKS